MEDRKIKILLVEDFKIAQRAAVMLLTQLNCEVDVAETGAQALEWILKKKHDLIFMDIGLPDMDGIAVTKKIRAIEKDVPIVALTANSDGEYKDQCDEVGMNGFLTKPLTPEGSRKILSKFVSHGNN